MGQQAVEITFLNEDGDPKLQLQWMMVQPLPGTLLVLDEETVERHELDTNAWTVARKAMQKLSYRQPVTTEPLRVVAEWHKRVEEVVI